MSQLDVLSESRESTAGGTTGANYANTSTAIPAASFVAGKRYLVLARAEITMNALNARGGIRLAHGTTGFDGATHEFTATINIAEWSSYFYFTVWQAVAGEALTFQTRSDGVARCDYRWAHLVAIRLDDSSLVEGVDWHYDEHTTDTVLTTSPQTGASLTFTPPAAGEQWLVMSRARLFMDFATDEFATRLDRTGEATASWEMLMGGRASGDSRSVPVLTVLTLGAVAQTFREQSRRIGTNGSTADRTNSAVLALRLARFDVVTVSSTDGHLDVGDAPDYVTQAATATHAQAVNNGKALVLAQAALDPQDTSSTTKFYRLRLQRANADEYGSYSGNGGRTHYPVAGDVSPGQVWPWTHLALRTLAAGSAAYDLDANISAANTGRGVKWRRIVVISLDVTAPPPSGGGGAALTAERNDQKMYLFDYKASRRRVRVRLKAADGSPITTAAGTQGAISKGGAAFTTTGVGVLVAEESSNGLYYAELTQAALDDLTSYRYRVTASGITETVTFPVEELPWLWDGAFTGGGANTATLGDSPPAFLPVGTILRIMTGPGAGESMMIDAYTSPTATMEGTWSTPPTSSSKGVAVPGLPNNILADVNMAAVNNSLTAASRLAEGAEAMEVATVQAGANSPTQIVSNLPILVGGVTTPPDFWKDRALVFRDSAQRGEQAFIAGSSVSGATTILTLDPNAALSGTPAVGAKFVVF